MKTDYGKSLMLRIGIITGSIILCTIAINVFSANLSSEAALVARVRALNQQSTHSSAALASLEGGRQKAAQVLATMNRFLPNQYELFKFKDWAERAGRTQGITAIASVDVGSLYILTDPLGYAPVTLAVSGNQNAVFSYLKFIEGSNGQYLITLDSVDISNLADANGGITLGVQGKLLFKRQ